MANTAPHHPNRILLIFANDSPVLDELNAYQKSFTSQLSTHLSAKELVYTIDQVSILPKTSFFLESKGLVSLQKLVMANGVKKRKNNGRLSVRDRMYIGIVDNSNKLMQTIEQLRNSTEITTAEPDFIGYGSGQRALNDHNSVIQDHHGMLHSKNYTNDRLFHLQWALENRGQVIRNTRGRMGEDINIIPAWNVTTGSNEITVAMLDSGLPDAVPDFMGRIVPGYNFVSHNASTIDDNGHGTNVTSIGFATGNNNGTITGIDWSSMIMPIKILDKNNDGLYSKWVQGIYWALDAGADVLNMSVGGSAESNILRLAVEDAINAGIHVVASMMNTNNDVTFYPAGYEGVVSVGAINSAGNRAAPFCWGGGSNYGNHIDLMAPGDWIIGLNHISPENGNFWCGTSQATPMVAAAISLMLSINPNLSPAEVKQILRETARGSPWNRFYGSGVLDVHSAIMRVLGEDEKKDVFDTGLEQNYPNPFNRFTTISYSISVPSHVRLSIYTIDGRLISVLVDELQEAGLHYSFFEALNLSSGTYLYELRAGGQHFLRQMTLIN